MTPHTPALRRKVWELFGSLARWSVGPVMTCGLVKELGQFAQCSHTVVIFMITNDNWGIQEAGDSIVNNYQNSVVVVKCT